MPGFGVIKISSVIFSGRVSVALNMADAITPDLGGLPDIESDAGALKQFREQLQETSKMIMSYKNLLKKDLTVIKKMGNDMERSDASISRKVVSEGGGS